ncbi:MAG: universal stress protein [Candidatus Marinimicrobia bacterium]|nr:universal stress protein [Candidatus Neomarinimicrobiota bacterium]
MFNHILIATDMSPKAISATKKAVQLAHQFNSRITLLNIHEEFMSDDEMQMLRVSVNKMKEEFHKTADAAKSEMKRIIHELHADDIQVEFLLREGKTPKTICSVAVELGADLIVLGTNGRDNIHDYILGTTSEYVVRHSKLPVLVIPGS